MRLIGSPGERGRHSTSERRSSVSVSYRAYGRVAPFLPLSRRGVLIGDDPLVQDLLPAPVLCRTPF